MFQIGTIVYRVVPLDVAIVMGVGRVCRELCKVFMLRCNMLINQVVGVSVVVLIFFLYSKSFLA